MPSKSSRTSPKNKGKGQRGRDHSSKEKTSPTVSPPRPEGKGHGSRAPDAPQKTQRNFGLSPPPPEPFNSASNALVPVVKGPPTGLEPIWKVIKPDIHKTDLATIAVVEPAQVKPMKELIKHKKQKHKAEPLVIITTVEKLQSQLDHVATKQTPGTELNLWTGPGINFITYHISNLLRKVTVGPCAAGRFDSLRIGSLSTYCGFKTYAWDNRPNQLRNVSKYCITHLEGCHWNISDDLETATKLFQPVPLPDPEPQPGVLSKIREGFKKLGEQSRAAATTPNPAPGNKPPMPGQSESWLDPWKAIISTVIGAVGGGVYAIGGFFWFTSTGIAFKGPLGLALSMGHTSCLFAGGSVAAVGGATFAAAALVYVIPWGKVFGILQRFLSKIWHLLCKTVAWVWEKIKGLAASFVELVTF